MNNSQGAPSTSNNTQNSDGRIRFSPFNFKYYKLKKFIFYKKILNFVIFF